MLALGGIRNVDRHFMPMSPEIEQQMMAQAQRYEMPLIFATITLQNYILMMQEM